MSVPVVTLADLTNRDPAVQVRVAEQIQIAFGTYGLIYIAEHGIPREDVLTCYDRYREVVSRPESEKCTWGGEQIWYQRGWTPPNTEKAVVAGGQPDFKECYFTAPLAVDPVCKRAWPEIYADNVWPPDAEAFRDGFLSLGARIHGIGLALLAGCERTLELSDGELTNRCSGAAHVTRLLKYLSLTDAQLGKVVWGEEHTDFNLLTLLPGGTFYKDEQPATPDNYGGLYLRTRPSKEHPNGQKVHGRPPPGCMVAQVGQQLEVLTAGRFTATPHVITAPEETGWTRCSMAHFIHMHGTETVAPLDEFADSPDADAYLPPVLAGTYAHKTLVDIGLAPAESLNKLGYRQYGRLSSWRASEA